ncbi:MAG: DNA recombination protein RmuC [Actinomycetota bacterium]
MELALIALIAVLVLVVLALVLRRPTSAAGPGAVAPLDLEPLLAPIREQLSKVAGDVQRSQVDAEGKFTTLGQQLRSISEQNAKLETQGAQLGEVTTRISTALQGTGVAGNWGEMTLRRTVELAGLTKHVSFVEQTTIETAEGKGRPDLVVRLPLGRHVIVDAKAPLIDFDGRQDAAATQAAALKIHVNDLASRNYSKYLDGAVDFVILFVPTEGILATTLGHDPSLSEYAVSKRVLLATPMTLLAMLRAVEYGWQQVAQAENVRKIASDAAELHDRLKAFIDHLAKVGTGLSTAISAYNAAVGSMQSSVRPQAIRMKEHGLTVTRELGDPSPIDTKPRTLDWRE